MAVVVVEGPVRTGSLSRQMGRARWSAMMWSMSENLRNYTKAIYALDAVVQRTPPEAWDNQSPCEDWTAREVLGHTLWGMKAITAHAGGGQGPAQQAEAEAAGPDPVATWNGVRDRLFAALDSSGAIHTVMDGPFGQMPIDTGLGIFFFDPMAHAWDIARAAGTQACLPADLCERAAQSLAAMGDGIRRPGVMGPAVEVDESADAEARFVAMTGRNPG